jgi:hypothetical protein
VRSPNFHGIPFPKSRSSEQTILTQGFETTTSIDCLPKRRPARNGPALRVDGQQQGARDFLSAQLRTAWMR